MVELTVFSYLGEPNSKKEGSFEKIEIEEQKYVDYGTRDSGGCFRLESGFDL